MNTPHQNHIQPSNILQKPTKTPKKTPPIMGFPVGYSDLFIPKPIVNFLTLVGFICNLISTILHFAGVQHLRFDPPSEDLVQSPPSSAVLLPVVKLSEIVDRSERCVVCLCEFDSGDEIRGLMKCKHVFHRWCIDRWMDGGRKSCPVCRTVVVPEELRDSGNERL